MARVSDTSRPVFTDYPRPAETPADPRGAAPAARSSRTELSWGDEPAGGSNAGQPSYGDMLMKLAFIRDMLRDAFRDYYQMEQWYSGQLRLDEVKLKMDGAKAGYEGKNEQAWGQIKGGVTTAVAGGVSTYGAAKGSPWQHFGDGGRGLGGALEGQAALGANEHFLKEQQLNIRADYTRHLVDTFGKCSMDALEGSKRASDGGNGSLRDLIQAIQQVNNAAQIR